MADDFVQRLEKQVEVGMFGMDEPLTFRDMLTRIQSDAAKIVALEKALEDIKQFGFDNTGYGYSCAKMAEAALPTPPIGDKE